jgi:hypothetical protein
VFAQVLWSAPVAAIFGYKGLARDEPNVVSACKGSGSRCYSGETANIMLASVFGAIALTAAGTTIVSRSRTRPWHGSAPEVTTLPRSSSQLETLNATGVISDTEYDQKRKQIISEL